MVKKAELEIQVKKFTELECLKKALADKGIVSEHDLKRAEDKLKEE